jgi:hypothetical protein
VTVEPASPSREGAALEERPSDREQPRTRRARRQRRVENTLLVMLGLLLLVAGFDQFVYRTDYARRVVTNRATYLSWQRSHGGPLPARERDVSVDFGRRFDVACGPRGALLPLARRGSQWLTCLELRRRSGNRPPTVTGGFMRTFGTSRIRPRYKDCFGSALRLRVCRPRYRLPPGAARHADAWRATRGSGRAHVR